MCRHLLEAELKLRARLNGGVRVGKHCDEKVDEDNGGDCQVDEEYRGAKEDLCACAHACMSVCVHVCMYAKQTKGAVGAKNICGQPMPGDASRCQVMPADAR